MSRARRIAFDVLLRVEQGGAYANVTLGLGSLFETYEGDSNSEFGFGWEAGIGGDWDRLYSNIAACYAGLSEVTVSNVGNEGGETVRDWLNREFQTEQLPFGDEWLVLFIGFVIVGIIGAIVAVPVTAAAVAAVSAARRCGTAEQLDLDTPA